MKLEAQSDCKLILSISNGTLFAGKNGYRAFSVNEKTTKEALEKELTDEVNFIDSIIACFNKPNIE